MGHIKIVVVGDSGVGKSSLIAALVSDTHLELVNANELTPIQLPGIDGGPPTTIIDTGGVVSSDDTRQSKDNWNERTKKCVKDSDAIIIVASCIHKHSIKNLLDVWMKRLDGSIPLTVAINFCEYQLEKTPNEFLDFDPIANQGFDMSSFENWINGDFRTWLRNLKDSTRVENVMLCSAATLTGVEEVFLKAIQSVLYPIAPLWDWEENDFSEAYTAILHRIWNVARGLKKSLDFNDFNKHQKLSFESIISEQDFAIITNKLQKKNKDFVGNNRQHITLDGFLELHRVLIRKGNRKSIWRKLRAMGYELDNGEIKFRDDYIPSFEEDHNVRYEWTPVVLEWLENIFDYHDEKKKDFLSINGQLRELLRPFPDGYFFAFGQNTQKLEVHDERFTRNAWLSLWALTVHQTPRDALEALVVLGYPIRENSIGQLSQYFVTKQPRSSDLNLIRCAIVASDKMTKKIDLLHCLKRGELMADQTECVNILPKSTRMAHFELLSGSGNWEAAVKEEDVCICFADLDCVSLVQKVLEKCVANKTPLIMVIEKKPDYYGDDQKELANKLKEWRKQFHIQDALKWERRGYSTILRDLDKRFGYLEKHIPYSGVRYLNSRNAVCLGLAITVLSAIKLVLLSRGRNAQDQQVVIAEHGKTGI